jgi:hypothetical protein
MAFMTAATPATRVRELLDSWATYCMYPQTMRLHRQVHKALQETPWDFTPYAVWPLSRILTEIRCGSGDWSWEEEWFQIDSDDDHAEEYADLQKKIRRYGILRPVLIGNDGRLWDGHHRLRIAVRLGIAYIPVELTP